MKNDHGVFEGARGARLFCRSWRPDREPVAVVVIVHGLGEHSGRYDELAAFFVSRRLAVEAYDLRGNGRSPGQRGCLERWAEFREDLARFVQRTRATYPGKPLVLVGHSLGGVVALDYALDAAGPLAGVVCSAPAIGPVCVSRLKWALARAFDRIWPTFSVRVLSESDLTHDPDIAQMEKEDPFTHSVGCARLAMELRRVVESIHARALGWRWPLLIVHSPDDRVASIEGSRRFAARAPGVRLSEYPGGAHELFNDVMRDAVLAETARWIDALF